MDTVQPAELPPEILTALSAYFSHVEERWQELRGGPALRAALEHDMCPCTQGGGRLWQHRDWATEHATRYSPWSEERYERGARLVVLFFYLMSLREETVQYITGRETVERFFLASNEVEQLEYLFWRMYMPDEPQIVKRQRRCSW